MSIGAKGASHESSINESCSTDRCSTDRASSDRANNETTSADTTSLRTTSTEKLSAGPTSGRGAKARNVGARNVGAETSMAETTPTRSPRAKPTSAEGPGFGVVPHQFRHEVKLLAAAGIGDWPALARVEDAPLRRLAASGLASEARLRRLRAQARLLEDLELTPQEASLLLHAGIPASEALLVADPQRLLNQVHRLQRRLTGPAVPLLPMETLRLWIRRARASRSRN